MNQERNIYLQLKRDGHDPFIDYLKGICILFVVLNHCLPSGFTDRTLFCIWGSTAVPIFLMLQVFHAFKKGINHVTVSYKKIWHRVVRPFLIAELLLVVFCFLRQVVFGDTSTAQFAETIIFWGGIGPGCYYPWIYIQFAVLMPFVASFLKLFKEQNLLLIFLVVSTLIEIIGDNMIPMRLYRLLFLRYLFIFYLGYILVVHGFIINNRTTIIALIGMAATLLFYYSDIYIYPFTNQKISICNWICYLYIAYGFLRILKCSQRYICLYSPIEKTIRWIGVHSYETFLLQMIVFTIID